MTHAVAPSVLGRAGKSTIAGSLLTQWNAMAMSPLRFTFQAFAAADDDAQCSSAGLRLDEFAERRDYERGEQAVIATSRRRP
jgi:hypothetical protein